MGRGELMTIGHSTRTLVEFIRILQALDVTLLATCALSRAPAIIHSLTEMRCPLH